MSINITGGVQIRGGTYVEGTTLTNPNPPTIGTATVTSATTATVTYTAPSFDGNTPIISYTAVSTPGNITATVSQSGSGSINVTGLNNGTSYTFKVYATNNFGNSQESAASNSITTDTYIVYGSGYNFNNDLGVGGGPNRSVPVIIHSASSGSSALSMYEYSKAIYETKSNGQQIYMWGVNTSGQLATNDTITRSTPQSNLLSGSSWKTVVRSQFNGYGIKTDGTLWAWGNGVYLGNNQTAVSRSSPIQIGSGTNWDKLFSSETYLNHVFAIKTDGSLWGWGQNDDNSWWFLGDGTTINRSSPVQIGAGISWSFVAPGFYGSMGLATNGNLYVWGTGSYGLNFFPGFSNYSVPTLVASNTNYRYIIRGVGFGALAITNDNKLFGWGLNQSNRILGQENGVGYSSPVPIMSDKSFSRVQDGVNYFTTLTTDNKIFVWGDNSLGQLGDGTTTYRSSPVQISITQPSFTLIPSGIFIQYGSSQNYYTFTKRQN